MNGACEECVIQHQCGAIERNEIEEAIGEFGEMLLCEYHWPTCLYDCKELMTNAVYECCEKHLAEAREAA